MYTALSHLYASLDVSSLKGAIETLHRLVQEQVSQREIVLRRAALLQSELEDTKATVATGKHHLEEAENKIVLLSEVML